MKKFNREDFIKRVQGQFPESGLKENIGITIEMADFRQYLEKEIEKENFWLGEKGFKLIEELLSNANEDLQNAIEICFIRDFAFGEHKPVFKKFAHNRLSKNLRRSLATHHEFLK